MKDAYMLMAFEDVPENHEIKELDLKVCSCRSRSKNSLHKDVFWYVTAPHDLYKNPNTGQKETMDQFVAGRTGKNMLRSRYQKK
jgi:hypothetical protein